MQSMNKKLFQGSEISVLTPTSRAIGAAMPQFYQISNTASSFSGPSSSSDNFSNGGFGSSAPNPFTFSPSGSSSSGS
jgi:hypothetical protein